MAIPLDDYSNDNVGTALVHAIQAMQRVQKMVKAGVAPAKLEHAIQTGELIVRRGRDLIAQADVCGERKQETLEWMDDYEARMLAFRPKPSTH